MYTQPDRLFVMEREQTSAETPEWKNVHLIVKDKLYHCIMLYAKLWHWLCDIDCVTLGGFIHTKFLLSII